MIEKIDDIIQGKSFKDEMVRFLPRNVLERTLEKEKFMVFLANEIKAMFLEIKEN